MAGGSRLRSCHPEPSFCHPERSRRVWVRGVGRCRITGGRFFAALRMTIWALRMTKGALGMAGGSRLRSCHPEPSSCHPEPSFCHPERSRRVWVRGVGRCRITGGRFFAALRMTIWALGMTKGALRMAGGSRLRCCHSEPPSCHPERSRRVWVRGVGRCRITDGRFFAALRMTIWALRMTERDARNGRWFTITFLSP